MSASANDLVRNAAPNFATTLADSMLEADTTMTLSSVTGLPTGTGITLTIDATNSSGVLTPDVEETVTGVVSSDTITNLIRGLDGTSQQAHASGAIVTMWFTANDWNDFQSAFLANHGQLHGYHKSLTDPNGNTWLAQTATSSAVNYLTLANAATTGSPTLTATGSDTNIGITLTPKGSGTINVSALDVTSSIVLPNNSLGSAALTYGLMYERQGGDSSNWSITGTSNYATSTGVVKFQSGAQGISGSSGASISITFPQAYTNAPLVFVSTITADGNNVTFSVTGISNSACTVRILFSGGGSASESFSWLSVGI